MNYQDTYNRTPFVVTFCSGKGGVGKSVIAANLAYQMSKLGYKTLIWDSDSNFPNQHLILGVEPLVRLSDVYSGNVNIETAQYKVAENLFLLADSPASDELKIDDKEGIINVYEQLIRSDDFDLIIIDTPSGASAQTLQCCDLSDLIQVVVTDEPTSLLDSYALLKLLLKFISESNINLLVNNAIDVEDAEEISTKFNLATNKFLNANLEVTGFIPYDRAVRQSIVKQELFILSEVESEVVVAIQKIAESISSKIEIYETA